MVALQGRIPVRSGLQPSREASPHERLGATGECPSDPPLPSVAVAEGSSATVCD